MRLVARGDSRKLGVLMFLVEDNRHGATYLVFTSEDPRKDGYSGAVTAGVSLDYDMEAVHGWADGEARPQACVGKARDNANHYKVFKYRRDLDSAEYQAISGTPVVFVSWRDYIKLNPSPEYLKNEDEEIWFERLDEYDKASRLRRERPTESDLPAGGGRDDVAAWLARKHLVTDIGVREVWYLPAGAGPDEIRFLELNDRYPGNGQKPEPIDFGLDIEGAHFRLFVADITSEQLERIKHDPSFLPRGWSLEGSKMWGRKA
jgi:hypothetical protein